MLRWYVWLAGFGLAIVGPSYAVAQERGVIVQLLVGGYSHLQNLTAAGPAAHWNTGVSGNASLGYQFPRHFGIHADATFATNRALGATPFAGQRFNRVFYGGHVEFRFPATEVVSPFLFAGGGAVAVDQNGSTGLATFTKPAGMFGAGIAVAVPRSRVSIMLEAKGLTYRWDRGGFDRTQLDVTYAVGLGYRFAR